MCSINKLISTFDHMEEHAMEYYGLTKELTKENLRLVPNVPIIEHLIAPKYLSICDDQWLIINRQDQSEDDLKCLLALNLLINPYVDRDEISINTNIEYYHNISDAILKIYIKQIY